MTRPPRPPSVPQPAVERMTPFAGRPAVVGVVPHQHPLVVLTAASWARAAGARLHLAYVDPARYVVEEHPDGTVQHAPVDPDTADDGGPAGERGHPVDGGLRHRGGSWWSRHGPAPPAGVLLPAVRRVRNHQPLRRFGRSRPGGIHRRSSAYRLRWRGLGDLSAVPINLIAF